MMQHSKHTLIKMYILSEHFQPFFGTFFSSYAVCAFNNSVLYTKCL
jgi:hypothetical protein